MAFKIEKEEYVNRTFRISKRLIDRMNTVCDEAGISLNSLVVKCVEYALDDLEIDSTES